MDQIHALGAAVSLSAAGASSIKGGNYQIFKNMLVNSDAKVHLGAQVGLRLFELTIGFKDRARRRRFPRHGQRLDCRL